ncbi:MAG: (2Fe-2S)-binding protein [Planctomycetes bacterium]|nr:(2Fe-2S)-binding protein [Planctomycetota bacterium]
MEKTINFTVNGQPVAVVTEPERSLLEVLREDLELTGTKQACGEGKCGACTVLIGGKSAAACVTPVAAAENQAVLTIEGLAAGDKLHPVQEAFLAENAFQCGHCTPGMIMAVVGLLNEKPRPADADILARVDGHICRCCGYPRILKAVKRAVAQGARQS